MKKAPEVSGAFLSIALGGLRPSAPRDGNAGEGQDCGSAEDEASVGYAAVVQDATVTGARRADDRRRGRGYGAGGGRQRGGLSREEAAQAAADVWRAGTNRVAAVIRTRRGLGLDLQVEDPGFRGDVVRAGLFARQDGGSADLLIALEYSPIVEKSGFS